MKIAYADPPYIGCAHRYPEKQEINHEQLIYSLCTEYDAWALSASSSSLQYILTLCPSNVRIASWVKPFASFKPNVNPAYTWEPVIFMGSRARAREELTVKDHLICNITLQKGVIGAKPEAFCYWIFELLGMQPEDEFYDLYIGSGVVTRCWEKWKNKLI